MALRFLLDEHLRGPLWQGIQHRNAAGVDVLDVLRVGDSLAPALGTTDPDLLIWAEQQGRILVSEDRKTMPGHFIDHLQAGRHSPGVFILLRGWTIPDLIDALVLYDQAGDPLDLVDQIQFIP